MYISIIGTFWEHTGALKGFHLDHECTEVYKNHKPEDSREMVSISAVISAIYQVKVSPIIREQMCIRLLNAPVVFSMKR